MRRLRVLIVEDDHALRSMICDNLKRLMGEERLEILCASDFHEGSALLAEEHFDIVIADFHLPGGDGAKIALRAFPTPAIIITADASDYPPIAAARVSTAGFLRKPFRAIHLLGAIAAALWQRDRKRITKWLFRNGP